jgi:DNA-3-methyladenine glycosylase II
MFLMFSLRRPDILPVGDLGVQKGLIRWALGAHNALPQSTKAKGKASAQAREKYGLDKKSKAKENNGIHDKVDEKGQGEIDTLVIPTARPSTPPPRDTSTIGMLPPTPISPGTQAPQLAILHTPDMGMASSSMNVLPPTPLSPGMKPLETFVVGKEELPPPTPEQLLAPPADDPSWSADRAVPLEDGLSVEVLKSRLSGKKVK